MRRTLKLEITAGEKTCYYEKGKPCPYVYVKRLGQYWVCHLFEKPLLDENGGYEGWLQRLPECLAAEHSG